MSIKAIHSILTSNATFTTASSGGVYSYMAVDGISQPYTLLFAEPSEPIRSQNTTSTKEWRDIVVACFAISPEAAKNVANKARGALEGFQGTVAGVKVSYCKYDGTDTEEYDRQLKKAIIELRFRVCTALE